MAKLILKNGTIPDLVAGQTQVFIRYRVVSEDKNRFSAWTPIFVATPTVPIINNITQINNDINAIEGDVSTLQGNITTINGNITTINNNVSTVNTKADDAFAIGVVL